MASVEGLRPVRAFGFAAAFITHPDGQRSSRPSMEVKTRARVKTKEIGGMARNLVVCFDGTNNQFGRENTNVVRLIQALDRDPSRQRLYYDPGVGTLPEPGVVTWLGKKISEWIGLAFGVGLTRNVEEAYTYLMSIWEPGDRVFLFGFSRGAYTARVLAGVLHALGLLPRGGSNMLPYVMRLFAGI